MTVRIDQRQIVIGSHTLKYDPYYVRMAAEEQGQNWFTTYDQVQSQLTIMRQVVNQWADGVEQMSREGQTIYLPYGLDDQWVESIAVTLENENTKLQLVIVAFPGWGVALNDLMPFITELHEIENPPAPLPIGSLRKRDFVDALRSAMIEIDPPPFPP